MSVKEKRHRELVEGGILAAAGVLLALWLRFPLLPSAPFLLYEPSDVPLLVSAMRLGPGWTALVAAVVAAVLGVAGGGGWIGGLSRFAGSGALGLTTAVVWRRSPGGVRSRVTSVAGGVAAYVLVEVLLTLVLGPLFMGFSVRDAAAMILPAVLPFNVIKGAINGTLALVIMARLPEVDRARAV